MASPQTAHGYTKVANSIMRALYRFPFSGQEMRLLLWVLRDSYGWGEKQTHGAPLSRICEETGIPRATASWVIRKMIKGAVLLQVKGHALRFNKNYDEWLDTQPSLLPLQAAARPILEAETKRAGSAFVTPTLEQVRSYCADRKSGIDPEKFWHHYEATGWMSGRTKLTNWKSKVCNWERGDQAAGAGKGVAVLTPPKCPVCQGPELKKGEKFCGDCARCRRCNTTDDLTLVPMRGGGLTVRCYKHF